MTRSCKYRIQNPSFMFVATYLSRQQMFEAILNVIAKNVSVLASGNLARAMLIAWFNFNSVILDFLLTLM